MDEILVDYVVSSVEVITLSMSWLFMFIDLTAMFEVEFMFVF